MLKFMGKKIFTILRRFFCFVYLNLCNNVLFLFQLPEMVKQVQNTLEKRMESPLMSLIIQNVGLLSGFCIILVLIIYAD